MKKVCLKILNENEGYVGIFEFCLLYVKIARNLLGFRHNLLYAYSYLMCFSNSTYPFEYVIKLLRVFMCDHWRN